MKLCFRLGKPTGGLGHSDQGAVFGLLRPDTASRMLVTQLLVLGDLFVRASHRISSYSYSVKRYSVRPSPFFSSAALRRKKKTDPQYGPFSSRVLAPPA